MNNDKLKEIINRIDYNLKEIFENVEITSLYNEKEPTLLIEASVLSDNKTNNAKVVIKVTESDIFDNSIIWKYKTNPMDDNSMLLERNSNMHTFIMDIVNIIKENRFSKEYNLSLLESINESKEEIADSTKYVITDIDYDTDDEVVDLPEELIIKVPNNLTDTNEIDDYISDEISNETGFLHKGYSSNRIGGVDDSYEFNLDEEVILEGVESYVVNRGKLEVGNISYNVYRLYIDSELKSVFEYDITKK